MENWYLPVFYIIPVSKEYYSDTVDIVPIIGYTMDSERKKEGFV